MGGTKILHSGNDEDKNDENLDLQVAEESIEKKDEAGMIFQLSKLDKLKPGQHHSIPIQIVDDTNPKLKANALFKRDAQLILGKGVDITMQGNIVYIKSKAWFIYFFALVMLFALGIVILLGVFLRFTQKQAKISNLKQKNTVYQQLKESPKEDLTVLNNIVMSKRLAELDEEEKEGFKIYKSKEEIYKFITNSEFNSMKIFIEAVKLRKRGNMTDDRKDFHQARLRLLALLKKGDLSKRYRRKALFQLWAVYHCHLHWKKSSREMRRILRLTGRTKLYCPKL